MSAFVVIAIVAALLVGYVVVVCVQAAQPHCRYCGKPLSVDHIPPEIRAAAKAGGLGTPLWYTGRFQCPNVKLDRGLAAILEDPDRGLHREYGLTDEDYRGMVQ